MLTSRVATNRMGVSEVEIKRDITANFQDWPKKHMHLDFHLNGFGFRIWSIASAVCV